MMYVQDLDNLHLFNLKRNVWKRPKQMCSLKRRSLSHLVSVVFSADTDSSLHLFMLISLDVMALWWWQLMNTSDWPSRTGIWNTYCHLRRMLPSKTVMKQCSAVSARSQLDKSQIDVFVRLLTVFLLTVVFCSFKYWRSCTCFTTLMHYLLLKDNASFNELILLKFLRINKDAFDEKHFSSYWDFWLLNTDFGMHSLA